MTPRDFDSLGKKNAQKEKYDVGYPLIKTTAPIKLDCGWFPVSMTCQPLDHAANSENTHYSYVAECRTTLQSDQTRAFTLRYDDTQKPTSKEQASFSGPSSTSESERLTAMGMTIDLILGPSQAFREGYFVT